MRTVLAAVLLLGLAACGRAPADPTVVAAMPSAIDPGEWTLTTTAPSSSRPGYPTAPAQEGPRVRTVCVSPVQAAAFDPAQLGSEVDGSKCHRDLWSVRDGAIDAQLVCPGHAEDIREVPTTIHGAYTHRSFWLQVDQTALGTTFSTLVKAERTGDC